MKKILALLILLITQQTIVMADAALYKKKINNTLFLEFERNEEKQSITWQTWLTNTQTKSRLMLDSYTLQKTIGLLGDPNRIQAGEDMIFHHDLANAILIDQSLYVIHNMQGLIFLRKYDINASSRGKESYFLTKYFAVGALGTGYQYADFVKHGDNLFILINAGCRMTQQNQRADWLFKFNLKQKELSSITFNSIEKKDLLLAKQLKVSDNPFEKIDLKDEKNIPVIKSKVLDVLKRSSKSTAAYSFIGTLENVDAFNDYNSNMHQRTSGTLFFLYETDHRTHVIRFKPTPIGNNWFVEDYTEHQLSGKED